MRSCFEKEMKNKKNWYYSMVVRRHLRNSINSVINAQKKKKENIVSRRATRRDTNMIDNRT